jgi:putative aldouronate transport system permease protein
VWFLPALANAFYIIIMRNFFREIPAELTESATIDGATLTDILFRIVVPLSAPVVATVALWAAVAHWNDWFFPLIFTPEKDKTVLQVLLRRVLVENQTSELELFEEHEVRNITAETVKAALLFISIGPIIAVYPFIQRYFVRGLMIGSLKG